MCRTLSPASRGCAAAIPTLMGTQSIEKGFRMCRNCAARVCGLTSVLFPRLTQMPGLAPWLPSDAEFSESFLGRRDQRHR